MGKILRADNGKFLKKTPENFGDSDDEFTMIEARKFARNGKEEKHFLNNFFHFVSPKSIWFLLSLILLVPWFILGVPSLHKYTEKAMKNAINGIMPFDGPPGGIHEVPAAPHNRNDGE